MRGRRLGSSAGSGERRSYEGERRLVSRLANDTIFQMHGGMGMTDELDIGHYAKRLMMINTTFGDATYHRNRYIETAYAA